MPPNARISIKDKHRSAKKYARRQFTYAERREVIAFAAASTIREAIARFYSEAGERGPAYERARLRIQKWLKNAAYIEEACRTAVSSQRLRVRPDGVSLVLPIEAEDQLLKWVNDLRRDGVPISTSLFRSQALEVAVDYDRGVALITASKSWIKGFLKRHKLSFRCRAHQGQQRAEDAQRQADEFAEEVRREAEELGVVNIINADQTAVFFEILPKRTMTDTGIRTVWVRCGKKEKQRAIVMVAADIFGKKYELFVIVKATPSKVPATELLNKTTRHGFGRDVWKQLEPLQAKESVRIYGNKSAWWNSEIGLYFLDHHFGDRPPRSPPIMLLLDHFSGHWTDEVKNRARDLNIVLKKIPAGLTWLAQPADVAWIKPLKDSLRRSWLQSLRVQLADHRRLSPNTRFALVPPSRETAIEWVSAAWRAIPASTIVAGFRRCKYITDARAEEESVGVGEEEEHGSDVIAALEEAGHIDGPPLTDEMDLIDNDCVLSDTE